MRIENDIKLDFKDVLIKPKRSTLKSRAEVSLSRTFIMPNAKMADTGDDSNSNISEKAKTWTGIPIFTANMDTTGTFEMAVELSRYQIITAIHKHYSFDEWIQFAEKNPTALPWISLSLGASQEDFDNASKILEKIPQIEMIMVDVANGYTEMFVGSIRRVRQAFPHHIIIAGNVVTAEMTEELILSGADIVKVGIGSGAACSTRIKSGVGYPQLSGIIECADAAHGLGGHIISDGGCNVAGDLAKAFGGGADFVMLGGMFAGHDESGGELIETDHGKFKEFYGMSSDTAMKKYKGGVAEYRSSEGKTLRVPYRGPVRHTVLDILGGIRSTCTYVGAKHLKELPKRTTFIRITQQVNNIYG